MKAPAAPWLAPYHRMLAAYGPQHWWPGETAFEVMVGAVLTQNTAWSNVERAIAQLKVDAQLTCQGILALPDADLAERIRPAGYYNVKARRLRALCVFLRQQGVADRPEALRDLAPLPELRRLLLAVHGVGEETADSILLYALHLPVFVVDAYTRRIFSRLGLITGDESYSHIQQSFQEHLAADVALFNEYHALIVHLGKTVCRPRPRCGECPLSAICDHSRP